MLAEECSRWRHCEGLHCPWSVSKCVKDVEQLRGVLLEDVEEEEEEGEQVEEEEEGEEREERYKP